MSLEPEPGQRERELEWLVATPWSVVAPDSWGFADFEIRADLLLRGMVALRRATAVFPDGTVVRSTAPDASIPPLTISSDVRNQAVVLALCVRREEPAGADGTRLHGEVADGSGDRAGESVGDGQRASLGREPRLLLESDVPPGWMAIRLARILAREPDGPVVLDEAFVPTVLHATAAPPIVAFLRRFHELLHQRGGVLAQRVSATGRGSASELIDFLMLQVVNRYESLIALLATSKRLHPEDLYRLLVMIAGDLATVSNPERQPPRFPDYTHHALHQTFPEVMAYLMNSFSLVLEPRAVPIPIEQRKYGIRVALVSDRSLYGNAAFVLAARADIPADELRRRFSTQVKIAPLEAIANVVRSGMAGIPLQPMPVAPRQIPYHAGFVYFELDQESELWAQVKSSSGIGLHAAGDFPGLSLELWAIRA
jgi:type VI secretion system protein ImpJ